MVSVAQGTNKIILAVCENFFKIKFDLFNPSPLIQNLKIEISPIGVIHTPYKEDAPRKDFENAAGEFYIELNPEYADGLYLLDKLTYCYVLFHFHKSKKEPKMRVYPPRGNGIEVGLWATRSPDRINPIGITIAKIKKIEGNRIYTFGLDILDGTPLLDIKPYIRDFDMKEDANMGWIDK